METAKPDYATARAIARVPSTTEQARLPVALPTSLMAAKHNKTRDFRGKEKRGIQIYRQPYTERDQTYTRNLNQNGYKRNRNDLRIVPLFNFFPI